VYYYCVMCLIGSSAVCICQGQLEVLQQLLMVNPHIDVKDHVGETALIKVCCVISLLSPVHTGDRVEYDTVERTVNIWATKITHFRQS